MGQCAWCGNYIKDSADKQALKSFGSMTGLDLLAPLGRKILPQYCSKQCKLAAAAAKNGGGSGRGESNNERGGAPVIVQKTSMLGDLMKPSDAQVQARHDQEAIFADRIKEGHESVMAVTFGDDAGSIANSLSALLSIINAHDPKTGQYNTDMSALKGVCKDAFDKMELGIMQLRSKGDAVQADYFQSKLTEKKEEGTLKGLGKKMGGLFGKK
jgi:hypothetical protein